MLATIDGLEVLDIFSILVEPGPANFNLNDAYESDTPIAGVSVTPDNLHWGTAGNLAVATPAIDWLTTLGTFELDKFRVDLDPAMTANSSRRLAPQSVIRSFVETALEGRGVHAALPVRSGQFVTTATGPGLSTQLGVADTVMAVLFYPVRELDISEISLEVTAAAAGNFKIGLFADDGTLQPGALIAVSGDISTGTTGIKTWTTAQTLNRDTPYWLKVHFSAGPTVRAADAKGGSTVLSYDRANAAPFVGLQRTGQAYASGMPASGSETLFNSSTKLPPLFILTVN
jgi:hypothetical protein